MNRRQQIAYRAFRVWPFRAAALGRKLLRPSRANVTRLAACTIHRGDLYWLGPDESNAHPHPHLVLQEDVLNRSRVHSVVVCALTSNLQRMHEPGNVLLEAGEGGLEKQSVVVVSQVSAVDKAALGARIGALSAERVEQVLAGLRFQQASYFGRE
jgi:mRNA interferase MazF